VAKGLKGIFSQGFLQKPGVWVAAGVPGVPGITIPLQVKIFATVWSVSNLSKKKGPIVRRVGARSIVLLLGTRNDPG
jgi:hypothetical protein